MNDKHIINEYFNTYYPKKKVFIHNEMIELLFGLFLGFFFSALKDTISNRAVQIVQRLNDPKVSQQFIKQNEDMLKEIESYAKANKELQDKLQNIESILSKLQEQINESQKESKGNTLENPAIAEAKTDPIVESIKSFTAEIAQLITDLQEKSDIKQNETNNLIKQLGNIVDKIGVPTTVIQDQVEKLINKNKDLKKNQREEIVKKTQTILKTEKIKAKEEVKDTKKTKEEVKAKVTKRADQEKINKFAFKKINNLLKNNKLSLNAFFNDLKIKKAKEDEKDYKISLKDDKFIFTFKKEDLNDIEIKSRNEFKFKIDINYNNNRPILESYNLKSILNYIIEAQEDFISIEGSYSSDGNDEFIIINKEEIEKLNIIGKKESISTKITADWFKDKKFNVDILFNDGTKLEIKKDKSYILISPKEDTTPSYIKINLKDYELSKNNFKDNDGKEIALENKIIKYFFEAQEEKIKITTVLYYDLKEEQFNNILETKIIPKDIVKSLIDKIKEKFDEEKESIEPLKLQDIFDTKLDFNYIFNDFMLKNKNLTKEAFETSKNIKNESIIAFDKDGGICEINLKNFSLKIPEDIAEMQKISSETFKYLNLSKVITLNEKLELKFFPDSDIFIEKNSFKFAEPLIEGIFKKLIQIANKSIEKEENKPEGLAKSELKNQSNSKDESEGQKKSDTATKPSKTKKTIEGKPQIVQDWPKILYSRKNLKEQLQKGSRLQIDKSEFTTFVRFKLKEVSKDKLSATYVGEIEYEPKDGITKTDLSTILESILNQERGKQLTIIVKNIKNDFIIDSIIPGKLTDDSTSLIKKAISTGSKGANKDIVKELFKLGILDNNNNIKVLNKITLNDEEKQKAVILLYIGEDIVYFKIDEKNISDTLTTLRAIASQKENTFTIQSYIGVLKKIENFNQTIFLETIKSLINLLKKLYTIKGYTDFLKESRKTKNPIITKQKIGIISGNIKQDEDWKSNYIIRTQSTEDLEKKIGVNQKK